MVRTNRRRDIRRFHGTASVGGRRTAAAAARSTIQLDVESGGGQATERDFTHSAVTVSYGLHLAPSIRRTRGVRSIANGFPRSEPHESDTGRWLRHGRI